MDYSSKTDVLCGHGDCHAYPQAEVTVIIYDQMYLLTVRVVNNLSFDVILGTDLPELFHLLQEEEPDLDVCMNYDPVPGQSWNETTASS